MAILTLQGSRQTETSFDIIKIFLEKRGVWHDRWPVIDQLPESATQEAILSAYDSELKPFMQRGGYSVADVISVNQDTPGIQALRAKFLKEHTHTEDEIRFFIKGEGLFWFHVGDEIFSLLCQAGDVISVPAQVKHWFDLGPKPYVKAIRIFTDISGWVPHYTNSGIDEKYNPEY